MFCFVWDFTSSHSIGVYLRVLLFLSFLLFFFLFLFFFSFRPILYPYLLSSCEYGKLLRQEYRFVLFCLGFYLSHSIKVGLRVISLSFSLFYLFSSSFRPILYPYLLSSCEYGKLLRQEDRFILLCLGSYSFPFNQNKPDNSFPLSFFLFRLSLFFSPPLLPSFSPPPPLRSQLPSFQRSFCHHPHWSHLQGCRMGLSNLWCFYCPCWREHGNWPPCCC